MSLAALCLNGFLAVLLLAALTVGLRLEKKLKGVRDGQAAFVLAVSELNAAAAKAQAALADLRAATDEFTDTLGGRIARGREISDRLERLVNRADALIGRTSGQPVPDVIASEPSETSDVAGGLAALLARLDGMNEGGRPTAASRPMPAPRAFARPARSLRQDADDDLFVDLGGRA